MMYPCSKCHGKGEIPSYSHTHGGVCFQCKGTGKQKSAPRQKHTPRRPEGAQRCLKCHRLVDQVMGVWYGCDFYCGDCEGEIHAYRQRKNLNPLFSS
jgi:RecJ-like exonuclease